MSVICCVIVRFTTKNILLYTVLRKVFGPHIYYFKLNFCHKEFTTHIGVYMWDIIVQTFVSLFTFCLLMIYHPFKDKEYSNELLISTSICMVRTYKSLCLILFSVAITCFVNIVNCAARVSNLCSKARILVGKLLVFKLDSHFRSKCSSIVFCSFK